MEEAPIFGKKIYFILSEKVKSEKENEVCKLEQNEKIINIEIIKQEKKLDYIYTLYSLTISDNEEIKNISLFITKSGEKYISSIENLKPYNDIFLFKVDFKQFTKNTMNNLNLMTLPYKEQYIIFKENIVSKNDTLIKNFCLSSLDYIHSISILNKKEDFNPKILFEFDFFLYLFLDCLYLNKVNKNENILNTFFIEFNIDLIDTNNCIKRNNSNKIINKELFNNSILESLPDYNKVIIQINSLIKFNELNEIKIILLLAFYYISYNPKLFINLISNNNKRKNETIQMLKKYRKLFNDFSFEVLDEAFNESENLDGIHSLLLLSKSLPDLLKIISSESLYIKMVYLCQIEGKYASVAKIIKPEKDDNMDLLKKSFDDILKLAKSECFSVILLSEEFFIGYCQLFDQVDLKKIEIILNIFNQYNKVLVNKNDQELENEIISYYYETGLQLIKNGKLINMDLILFIDKLNKFSKKKIEFPKEAYSRISISNDITFVNSLLNGDYKDIFGDDYMNLIKSAFDNLKTLKDFMNLVKWGKDDCEINEVLYMCFDQFKKIWFKERENNLSEDLINFIAELIIIISRKKLDFINELIDLEKKINNNQRFLDIYSTILKKGEYITNSLSEHLKKYIYDNIKEGEPLTIWYKLFTFYDETERINYLLQNLSIKYAIRLEDFINYPLIKGDRLKLFTNLYNDRYFIKNENIAKTEYYKESIESKDKINTLKYKDAINFCKNIISFQALFLYFLPNRFNEDNDYLIDALLIDFYELYCKCKEQYNSLKLVLNYWKHFFNITKQLEIEELNTFLNKLDNTPIIEFNKYESNFDGFLFYINEAETKDKLFNSFFFMGLYQDNAMIFQKNEEKQKFDYTLKIFNKLKQLGSNSNIEILPNDLLNKLIILVYKNNDRLDDELSFIKEYFEFDKNEKNYFDIFKIKKTFNNLVDKYKSNENLDDYKLEFNDDLNIIKNEEIKKGTINTNLNTINTNTNTNTINANTNKDNAFNLLSNDDDDNDDFTLFGNFNDETESSNDKNTNNIIINNNEPNENIENEKLIEKEIETKKSEILKELKNISYNYYSIYRIYIPNNSMEDSYKYIEQLKNFFWEIFNNIHKYDILTEKEFYEEVIYLMNKIFLTGAGLNIFTKNNKEVYFIYEFFEILDIYKKFHLINKIQINKIIEKFIDYKNNENKENINIIDSIDNLFMTIEENIPKKAVINLFIKLLLVEKNKIDQEDFNIKMITLIMRDEYKYLLGDSLPLIDEIFKEDITSKIILNEENEESFVNIIEFSNYSLNQIEKKCNEEKNFEELILYYFESKIISIFNKIKNKLDKERDLYQNPAMKNYLTQCLNLLENESRGENNEINNNKKITILFCIAYVKCFLSNYIRYLYNHNQDIGDVKDINENIIKGYGNNQFRTYLKLYILKLFFNIFGNYKEFSQFNYTNYQVDYFQNNDILKIKNEENINIRNKYGFDYLFIPSTKEELSLYINMEQNLVNLGEKISENNSNNLNNILKNNNNFDIFYCCIVNIFLSNYHINNYFNKDEYKNICQWINDNLILNKDFNKISDIEKNILSLFVDNNTYKSKIIKINDNINNGCLTYNQLLSLLFSLRYVLHTLSNNNSCSLYYLIITNGKFILESNDIYINYYTNDFKTYNNREINHLTFSIIRFILLSHLYFFQVLNNINLKEINNHFLGDQDDLNFIEILEKEFKLIKDILELKGIKKNYIIIFMNYIFNDIKAIISNIERINEENYIKNIESNIETEITKYIEGFDYYIEEYNNNVAKELNIKNDNDEFKKIILEDKELYNNKNMHKKYNFISYLTLTNFSSINDFKSQFYNFINDKNNYPMTNCILDNYDIIKITKNLPYINKFLNKVYNELVLKIKKEDLDKTINSILSDNIKNEIETFNKNINEINKLKSFSENKIDEINVNSKISEIINIKDNLIYKLFNNIIKIYNEFLINSKIYKDNKNLIEPIIIQNASENDYYILDTYNNRNNENYDYNDKPETISAYDRLQELTYLYSKKNRYNKDLLNVYNGGKIIYDFNQIEMILQKEYLNGKKPFQENQKLFMFSNEVFSGERYNLIENIKNKYPLSEKIEDLIQKELEMFINDENKTKDIYKEIYINLQYILIYLYDNNIFENNISLKYITKVIERSNYKINESLIDFLSDENIHINHLIYLYENIEIKCFDYMTDEVCNEIKDLNIKEENITKINEYFKTDKEPKLLLNENLIINCIKKYILRYCIGNYQEKSEIVKNINLANILNKADIWSDEVYKNDKFKDEVNNLMNMNDEDCLMNYFLSKLFKKKKDEIKEEKKEEKKEEEVKQFPHRKRKKGIIW